MVCDEFGGSDLAVAEFGMLMNVASPRDDPGLERLDLRDYRGCEDAGLLGVGDRCSRKQKSETGKSGSSAHRRDVKVHAKLPTGGNWGQSRISLRN